MKRSLAVALGLLLALTVLGVAWAAWSATLYVKMNVKTKATYDVAFVDVTPTGTYASDISATVDGLTLTISVTGAEPGRSYPVNFKFKNTGTGPIEISRNTTEDVLPASEPITVVCTFGEALTLPLAGGATSAAEYTVTLSTESGAAYGTSYGEYKIVFSADEDVTP